MAYRVRQRQPMPVAEAIMLKTHRDRLALSIGSACRVLNPELTTDPGLHHRAVGRCALLRRLRVARCQGESEWLPCDWFSLLWKASRGQMPSLGASCS